MDGIHGCLNGLLTGGGADSEGVAVGVVVNRKAEIGGRSMQVFEYLGFDGLVLRPRGLFGIAIDVESHPVALRGIHAYQHILRGGVYLGVGDQVGTGIGAEQAEVGVDGAVDSV